MSLFAKPHTLLRDMLYITSNDALNRSPDGIAEKGETGKVRTMKSFVLAVAAMAVIAIGAHFGLAALDRSAGNVYLTENVRR
jgi:hypothetical protein